jgi:hypothetical protein
VRFASDLSATLTQSPVTPIRANDTDRRAVWKSMQIRHGSTCAIFTVHRGQRSLVCIDALVRCSSYGPAEAAHALGGLTPTRPSASK